MPVHVSRSAPLPAGCDGMNSRTLTSIFMHDIKVFPERRCALTGGSTGDDTESERSEGAGVGVGRYHLPSPGTPARLIPRSHRALWLLPQNNLRKDKTAGKIN